MGSADIILIASKDLVVDCLEPQKTNPFTIVLRYKAPLGTRHSRRYRL